MNLSKPIISHGAIKEAASVKEKRYIKKSTLEKYTIPEWMIFFKSAEVYEYIVTDDNGNVIDSYTD